MPKSRHRGAGITSRPRLREGDLRPANPLWRGGFHERSGRADGRHRGLGVGHGPQARRARAGQPRALQGRRAHRRGPHDRAGGAPPPPPARALPDRVPGRAVGSRPRRGRGARARALRGARGADRDEARQPHPRPARRPNPHPRRAHRGDADRVAAGPRAGGHGHVRARLGLRPGDAPLPLRPGNRAGRRARGHREAAVRRAAVRPLRRSGARARRHPRPPHARGGQAMSPPPPVNTDALVLQPTGDPLTVPVPSALESLRARGRLRTTLALLGPAFVAAIAYVDPGNFATNIAGGAKYGYLLLWVILGANLMAMLIQYLSAKAGIATGHNLAELCREHFPRPVAWGLWVQAEIIAMATDLAEFVGAAIALNLLFGVPPFLAGLMTAVVAFAILALQRRGHRRFETAIAGLL